MRARALALWVLLGCGGAPSGEPPASGPPAHLWSHSLGRGQADAVAIDLDGHVLVAGAAADEGSAEQPARSSVLLVKLDPAGSEIWRKRFGGAGFDGALALVADPGGNVVLAGGFTSKSIDFGGGGLPNRTGRDTFVAKLSPSGRHMWSKAIGARPEAVGLATDASGNVLVTGTFVGSADFGGGALPDPTGSAPGPRVLVSKIAPSGGHLWTRRYGGRLGAAGAAIATDAAGAAYVTGSFAGSIDFGGGLLGRGEESATSGFALKLDPDGRHVWSRAFGRGRGRGIAVDPAGAVLLAGEAAPGLDFGAGPLPVRGGLDAFVARLGPDGGTLWARTFGDDNDQRARHVATDAQGRALVTGEFQGTIDFGGRRLINGAGRISGLGDVFLAALGPDGAHVFSRRFGDASDNQAGTSVATDAAGDLLLAGWFASTIDLGGGSLATGGRVTPASQWGSDLSGFVAKFRP